jgi:hypothetical protein
MSYSVVVFRRCLPRLSGSDRRRGNGSHDVCGGGNRVHMMLQLELILCKNSIVKGVFSEFGIAAVSHFENVGYADLEFQSPLIIFYWPRSKEFRLARHTA